MFSRKPYSTATLLPTPIPCFRWRSKKIFRVDRRLFLFRYNKRLDAAFVVEMIFFAIALVAQADGTPEFRNDSSRRRFSRDLIFRNSVTLVKVFRGSAETYHRAGFIGIAERPGCCGAVLGKSDGEFAISLDNQFQFLRQALTTETPTPCRPPGDFIGYRQIYRPRAERSRSLPPPRRLLRVNTGRCHGRSIRYGRVIGVNSRRYLVTRGSASSIALSTTSNTMWCRPVPSSVSPIYIPGQLTHRIRHFQDFVLEVIKFDINVSRSFPNLKVNPLFYPFPR